MIKLQKVVGWGAGSAYANFIDDFPIVKELLDYLVDSNYERLIDSGSLEAKNPDILKDEDKRKTLIIIFSEYYNEILLNSVLDGFQNIITVWDIRKSPVKYINLILSINSKAPIEYISERSNLLQRNSNFTIEQVFNHFNHFFNKIHVCNMNLGELMKTELHFLSEYMTNFHKEYILYEINTPTKLEFAVLGNGPILISSLMYSRLDHVNLMNQLTYQIGKERVTRLMYYDDYLEIENELENKNVSIHSYDVNQGFINDHMIDICEIWERSEFYFDEKIKKWLNNHVAYSIGLIKLYEELLDTISVSSGIFVFDYFREEYLLATLLNLEGKLTYTMQHGFYMNRNNSKSHSIWGEIYHTHGPAKKKLVWGNMGKQQLNTWGVPKQDILIVGNPKYPNHHLALEKYKKHISGVFNILVVLGIDENDNENLLSIIYKYRQEVMVDACIFIKMHPRYTGALSKLSKYNFKIIDEMFVPEIIEKIDIACTVASVTYYELLVKNLYVLMRDTENIVSTNEHSTFTTYEKFIESVERWSSNEKYREEYIRNAKQELNLCFSTDNEILKEEFNN
ncbi:hypothetical protein [Psychrobacillus psychrodurans]|uniref:CDP-Glycerol:Poly(Glycerophosphate) glycerophosphotransferase n=1 Tax=Psychrobacillus psychrodurans TaxID=126157 RepID=A0A9X3L5Q5_9BACI|nr:hypothetical protein [Psychrobacillus psychrodurans]MCZ8531815.1 hypothetical protein [Psychrobacillus psychrodurans]